MAPVRTIHQLPPRRGDAENADRSVQTTDQPRQTNGQSGLVWSGRTNDPRVSREFGELSCRRTGRVET